MKRHKLAALAFALFTAWGGSASAASVDYDLSMPLADVSASDPTPTFLLRGTLSYDDDAMSGSGDFTFTNGDWSVTKSFAGFSFLLPYDDSTTGALFDGEALDGSELYFNVLANSLTDTIASGFVSYCSTGCLMFNSVGASITPATLPGVGLPGGIDLPGGVDLPGAGVSPVPLPPAVSLFGAALLGLAGLGAFRRRTRPAARTQEVAIRI